MSAPLDVPRGLTYAEAAEALGVHKRTILKWVRAGRLVVRRIGPRTVRIDPADLRALWERSRETGAPVPPSPPPPPRKPRAGSTGNPVADAILARRRQRRGSG